MLLINLSVAASLLASAFAGPVAAPDVIHTLAKRAEGVHLVNCNDVYSSVVYCPNDSNCNFGPSSPNLCIPGGLDTWESNIAQSCAFNTGVTFTWLIQTNAQSQPNFSKVGTANNGNTKFNIFKDDKHTMYVDGNNYQCRSIYYALDA